MVRSTSNNGAQGLLPCVYLATLAFAAAMGGCSNETSAVQSDHAAKTGAGGNSNELVTWFEDYKSWKQLTEQQLSPLHWQQEVVVYAQIKDSPVYYHNHKVYQLELEGEYIEDLPPSQQYRQYQTGAVIAKENYDVKGEARSLATVNFMVKQGKDDWRYIELNAEGEILHDSKTDPEAAQARCVFCHEPLAARDYIFHTLAPRK